MKAKKKNANSGFKATVVGAVKFFFMGDDEPLYDGPSSAMRLSDEQLDMVSGGDPAAANAYLGMLCKKYSARNKFDALSRATDEEWLRHVELYFS